MVYIPGRNSAVSVARCLALAIALSVASATASAQPAGISLKLAYESNGAMSTWRPPPRTGSFPRTGRACRDVPDRRTDRFGEVIPCQTELTGRIEKGRYVPHGCPSPVFRRTARARRSRPGRQGPATSPRSVSPSLTRKKVFPLADEHIDGAIDPFSAMLNALNDIARTGSCNGSERVYDGLRTSELTLHDLGTTVLEKDRPFAYEGKALVCGFVGRPTSGHQRKSRWRKDAEAGRYPVFVSEVQPDLFIPVRIRASSVLGTVTARLVMPSLKYETN